MLNKLEACELTRSWTAESLLNSLGKLISSKKPISETLLRDEWLLELRKKHDIFPDGWYMPPPHGITVLFGTENKLSRSNYISLRLKSSWPQSKYMLNKKNPLAYVYMSSVSRKLGIIGDFGMTLYFGKNIRIKNHLKRCFRINNIVFDYIKIGMSFSEVYNYTIDQASKLGLLNNITSKTDPTGVNIGHTVPMSYEDWNKKESSTLKKGEWKMVKDMISKKRKFVSPRETMTYQPDMAVTLEPRFITSSDPEIPMTSFHTIVIFDKKGKKKLLTNFSDIFKLAGMDYIMT